MFDLKKIHNVEIFLRYLETILYAYTSKAVDSLYIIYVEKGTKREIGVVLLLDSYIFGGLKFKCKKITDNIFDFLQVSI